MEVSGQFMFGGVAKHPGWDAPAKDRSKVSIDWDKIRENRRERILWEIEQGLNPVEAPEVTGDPVQEKPKRIITDKSWINTDGAPRKYNHEEIIRLYEEEGHTGTAIAKALGANKATIYGILRSNNVERRKYSGGRNQFSKS